MNGINRRELLALSLAGAAAQPLLAQTNYPNKTIRMIVPFAAGGSVDMMGRALTAAISPVLGVPMVIENRGGAGGIPAVSIVASAPPDGHTLLVGSIGPVAIAPAVFSKVPFDPVKNLAAVALIAKSPYLLVSSRHLPATNLRELIALMKQKPGEFNFASAGAGGPDHLAAEQFKRMAGVDAKHIPFKGAAAPLTEIGAGRIHFFFVSPLPAIPLVEAGLIRALAVTGSTRSAAMPNIPTVAETIPGYDVVGWYGMFAPGGTPPEIVNRLNQVFNTAIATPELQGILRKAGLDPVALSAEDFGKLVANDVQVFGKLAREAGVTAD